PRATSSDASFFMTDLLSSAPPVWPLNQRPSLDLGSGPTFRLEFLERRGMVEKPTLQVGRTCLRPKPAHFSGDGHVKSNRKLFHGSHRGVAEYLASIQVLHLHGKFCAAPFSVMRPRTLERIPRGAKALKLCEKLSAFIPGKGNERSPCIV